jgi:hypothetical protein
MSTAGFVSTAFGIIHADRQHVHSPFAGADVPGQFIAKARITVWPFAEVEAGHEAFQASERRAFQGRCFAIIRGTAPGRINIVGSAKGLAGNSVVIAVMH